MATNGFVGRYGYLASAAHACTAAGEIDSASVEGYEARYPIEAALDADERTLWDSLGEGDRSAIRADRAYYGLKTDEPVGLSDVLGIRFNEGAA